MPPQNPGDQYNPNNNQAQPNPGQQPYNQYQYQHQQPSPGPGGSATRKKILVIVGGLFGTLFIIAMVGLLFYSMGRSSVPEPEEPTMTTIEESGPQPASRLDIERIQNSIGRDISELSEDADFAGDYYSDSSLGL